MLIPLFPGHCFNSLFHLQVERRDRSISPPSRELPDADLEPGFQGWVFAHDKAHVLLLGWTPDPQCCYLDFYHKGPGMLQHVLDHV